MLVTDAGETILDTGDCAGFKAGDRDGHHLQNRGETTALILEVGTTGRRRANRDPADRWSGPAAAMFVFGALIEEVRFAVDSPLEGDGFEPSVPQLW
jgi:hypothetical protein